MPRPELFPPLRCLTVLTLSLLVAGCRPGTTAKVEAKVKGADPERIPLVRCEPVRMVPVQQKIETTAYLEAEHTVTVFARVAGRVLPVKIDEGNRVERGALLAELDDAEVKASLRQVEVQLAEKRVRHQLAKLEHEAMQHRESQAQLELQKTIADLGRLEGLEKDLISPKDLDDARYAKNRAIDAHRVAQFNTRKAKLDIDVAAQAIQELEARQAEVRIRLAEHRILAPISGVVAKRQVKGGEVISTTNPLFEVTDTSRLVSYLDRPQRELGLVEQAKRVVFTTDAYGDRKFHATVDLISPVVDRDTGSFKIRVRVVEADAKDLRPGLYIRAQILTEDNRDAILVPKTAVLADGDDRVVFFVREPDGNKGKARRLRLEAGIETEDAIEVKNRGAKRLQVGDLVIVSGHQDLRDQTEVEISKG
ncbi:MAG: efflux RND transporter periplasmic adaptor subunit [Planctomycetes bacterium]|nr:efflux RND transporter periplasmic adaptor subunit [Planctomycetota bacterium]